MYIHERDNWTKFQWRASELTALIEAVSHYAQPLAKAKLCAWQAAFFPTGFSEGSQIEVGKYRTHEEHIVSGMFGRENIIAS